MYQNKNCFSIKQYILTTSCLDILIDRAFISNEQHHPISLKYSLWPGYLGNRAVWKKEVFSRRQFPYFEICFPSEASPICKKETQPSVSEVTYWFFNSLRSQMKHQLVGCCFFFLFLQTAEKEREKLTTKFSLLQQNLIGDKF